MTTAIEKRLSLLERAVQERFPPREDLRTMVLNSGVSKQPLIQELELMKIEYPGLDQMFGDFWDNLIRQVQEWTDFAQ